MSDYKGVRYLQVFGTDFSACNFLARLPAHSLRGSAQAENQCLDNMTRHTLITQILIF